MRELYEIWKNRAIYHNAVTGQFETESGFTSYELSRARLYAVTFEPVLPKASDSLVNPTTLSNSIHPGKRIEFDSLPGDVQKFILQNI